MKKRLSFLRSMKFGMILLVVILVLCFAGSMIVQGRGQEEYAARYGETGAHWILALGLDRVFTTPYFILAGLALCANLTDCSVARLKNTLAAQRSFEERGEKAVLSYVADGAQLSRLQELLAGKRYRRLEKPGRTLYVKDRAGVWGSFCTHLGLLLVLFVGTAVLYGARVQDIPLQPGKAAVLEDGTQIVVDSFRMTDDEGSLDYESVVNVTLPNGKSSGPREIRVNTPLRMGNYKVYQQNYYQNGIMEIRNEATGVTNQVSLDESCFLTLDGEHGYYFEGLYFGYEKDEAGGIRVSEGGANDYTNPLYVGYRVDENGMTPAFLFPGEEVSAGGVTCRAEEVLFYPGLRVKALPGAVLAALYVVFGFLVAALWLCFFCVPILVAVGEGGFAIISAKAQTGLLLELEAAGFVKTEKRKNGGKE